MDSLTSHKTCICCNRLLPATVEFFWRNNDSRDGLKSRCKMCCKFYKTKIPFPERFWLNVNKTERCWLWTGGTKKGRGVTWFNGRCEFASRVSYQLFFGVSPGSLDVLHTCDIPLCVNPEHLFLGTQQDNADDMTSKGRQARGETAARSKLTENQVKDIRIEHVEMQLSQAQLASKYHVSQSAISRILLRQTWGHI